MEMKSRNERLFDLCIVIQISLHLYVQVYLNLLVYCGADEVTVESESFYSNSEPVTLRELQFTVCRGMDSIVAGRELSLFFCQAALIIKYQGRGLH